MPYHHNLRHELLTSFTDRVKDRVYRRVAELEVEVYLTPEPVPFEQRTSGSRRHLSVGDSWGHLWDCGWFLFRGVMPPEAIGLPTVLRIDVSGELCVFGADGVPIRGLTTFASEFERTLGRPGKTELPWSAASVVGQGIELWADGGCNDLFGKYPDSGTLKRAEVAVVREDVRALSWDVEVLWDLVEHLPKNSARYGLVLQALFEASLIMVEFHAEEVAEARTILARELGRPAGDPGLNLSAVGHAHIDLAWLWPLRETRRKTARTFATALANLDTYPQYVFGASQPQQYQWLKEDHPALYSRIFPRVAEGRWEAQGGMWVEPDTNIPSGESLVRQLIYGIRFFQEEFGVKPKMVWLPDTFGYSGNLPQIMKKAGIRWFMTTKLTWNKFNIFPHHSFQWIGIDGSSVLVHMAPEGTYNSSAAPRAVLAAEQKYLDKSVSEHALLIFGIGDGGGGPGEEHLERLARIGNLNGLAPVRQELAETFFERLEAESNRFQSFSGELYLERHQGTYTTQSRNKRWNRRMEESLGELELLAVMAELRAGLLAPREELESIWKEVLLYQFHDILPGSSIGRVYEESVARYEHLYRRVRELQTERLTVLGATTPSVFNPLPWSRVEWIRTSEGWFLVQVPAFSVQAPEVLVRLPIAHTHIDSSFVLENELVQLEFSVCGRLTSLRLISSGREALGGEGNLLTVWPDEGDAWDFSPDYRSRTPEYPEVIDAVPYTDGPTQGIRFRYQYRASVVTQDCRLTAGSARLDFVTKVDWQERGRMLRVSFPTTVHSDRVECEIQFGSLYRSTKDNTSLEQAQYEVCAHRWVNLSEEDFGVALLNDGKYGHYAKGSVLDLNLLRSPGIPDPEADRGIHEFTYSVLVHRGEIDRSLVMREAGTLNQPLRWVPASSVSGPELGSSLVTVDGFQFVIDVVKLAEDGQGVVVRGHESLGRQGRTLVTTGFDWASAHVSNLLEVPQRPLVRLSSSVEEVAIEFEAYEVVTLVFRR